MLFRNRARVYMSPEEGVTPTGGAPEPIVEQTPVPTPETPAPAEVPVEAPTPEKEVDKSKLGQVTSLVEASGLTMKEVAEYAKANDGSIDLDTMVALKEKHGDAVAALIADQIKGIHTEKSSAATARDQAVYDQVEEAFKDTADEGQTGQESWKELAEWTKAETDGQPNISQEHRSEINDMLSRGGLAAKLAVQELTNAFKDAHGKSEFQDAELLEADKVVQSTVGGNITKQDYAIEMRKLESAGHVYGTSSEMKKLDARRMKSINAGY